MGYKQAIISGFSWGAVLNFIAMAISAGKIVLLSRFIFGPEEFGVFGVGVLVLGILELITETGINVFLIQEKDPVKKYLDTAWVVSIVRGILIASVLALLSYPIAKFFDISSQWMFILSFSLIPLLRGFINPAIANLQKKLRFKQGAIYRFTISVITDLSILILAFATHNLFSFVTGMIIATVIEIWITFAMVPEKPKLRFNGLHFKNIVHRGKWVTLAAVFDYLYEHTDDVAVGKFLNVFSLGIYQNSYTLASLPLKAFSQQLGKVTFPVFVLLNEENTRVKKAFWKTFWVTSAIVIPFGLALFALSDSAVRILLGPKWLDAIPVLQILALFSIARALTELFYPLFFAYKKQNYVTITTIVSWIVLGVAVIPLTIQFGIIGAATAALIGSVVGLPVAFFLFNKTLAR